MRRGFFRRKKSTRRIMTVYYVTGFMVALYLTVLPNALFNMKLDQGDILLLVSGVFGFLIWVPYFIFSRRINLVFSN